MAGRRSKYAWASGGVALLLVAGAFVFVRGQSTQELWPPQFPREGATKLFENDEVIIWEQIGRPAEPIVHRHVRDLITITLEPGSVRTRDANLQPTDASLETTVMSTRLTGPGAPNTVWYSKAGLGPHAEVVTDPSQPGREIMIEVKGTEPADCREWSTACQ